MSYSPTKQQLIEIVASDKNATASTLQEYFRFYEYGDVDDLDIAQFNLFQAIPKNN